MMQNSRFWPWPTWPFVAIWPLVLTICATAIGGCATLAPATVPAHLQNTPGPPVIVADEIYQNIAFSAVYPVGWRVVTSPADRTPYAVFVHPDESALIVLALDADDAVLALPGVDDAERVTATITLDNGTEISAALVAMPDLLTEAERAFRMVLDSLRVSAP